MLHFPEEYFKTEERDGFLISELMKKAWAAQLEVLSKIIAVCDKYHLTYYAYWGTLLGAVRHQGFIPWDDDLDIALKKDDYIKFLEVARKELPQEYCILNCYTDPEYENAFSRITNGREIDLSEKRMKEYHGCPFSVGVDIFPLYYVPRDTNNAGIQNAILNAISEILKLVESTDSQNEDDNVLIMEGLVELEKATGYQFTADRPLHNHLKILYDQISRLFEEAESDAVTLFPKYMKKGYIVEKELLSESIQLPFENITLNAPKGYDAILRKTYNDYMVPRKVRAAHDYPFYKGQLQVLVKHMKEHAGELKGKVLAELQTDEKTGIELPKEWKEKIYVADRRKKIILYHTSADTLISYSGHVLEKLRYVFEAFRDNEDVLLWWVPGILENTDLSYYIQQMLPQMFGDYSRMTEEFLRENIGIYDDSGDMQRAVAMADAYYGDESELLQLFKEAEGVAMVQDYEIVE